MLSEHAVFADSFGALDIPGKGLRVAFEQALVYQPLAAALLEPQPCFLIDFICTEGLTVLLKSREVIIRAWHIHAFQLHAVTDIVNIEVGHVVSEVRQLHTLCRCAFHNFVGEGVRLGASFDTPPAAIGSVFRHVDHFHFCGAGFNTLFELQFLRKRPRAVFRGKGS